MRVAPSPVVAATLPPAPAVVPVLAPAVIATCPPAGPLACDDKPALILMLPPSPVVPEPTERRICPPLPFTADFDSK